MQFVRSRREESCAKLHTYCAHEQPFFSNLGLSEYLFARLLHAGYVYCFYPVLTASTVRFWS